MPTTPFQRLWFSSKDVVSRSTAVTRKRLEKSNKTTLQGLDMWVTRSCTYHCWRSDISHNLLHTWQMMYPTRPQLAHWTFTIFWRLKIKYTNYFTEIAFGRSVTNVINMTLVPKWTRTRGLSTWRCFQNKPKLKLVYMTLFEYDQKRPPESKSAYCDKLWKQTQTSQDNCCPTRRLTINDNSQKRH